MHRRLTPYTPPPALLHRDLLPPSSLSFFVVDAAVVILVLIFDVSSFSHFVLRGTEQYIITTRMYKVDCTEGSQSKEESVNAPFSLFPSFFFSFPFLLMRVSAWMRCEFSRVDTRLVFFIADRRLPSGPRRFDIQITLDVATN